MYTVFLILHVVCGGIWIGLVPAMMVLAGQRNKSKGTLGELYLIRAMGGAAALMGNLGGIGILISGGAIVGIAHFGWFPFGTLDWLAVKQTIYVILLGMSFGVMLPLSKKIQKLNGEAIAGPNASRGASAELSGLVAKTVMFGRLMGLMVLINIILGVWKPTF
ncbi:MAG: hypothetical protein ABI444_08015 [Candidatus Kapaibacterium sp.]|jgi:hypothetical protein